MKRFTLLFVSAFIIQTAVISQSCLPEGIIFTTQSQVDSFQINYPDCTMVEGDIEISGDDITNLEALSVLTVIEGDLFIGYNTALTNLTGLENVGSIGQTVRIYMNSALVSLSGLDNVTTIGQNLRITNNENLEDISSLGSLTAVGENLRIYMNPALLSLSGLDNVTSVGDNLRITNNTILTSIEALINITTIGGELAIDNNDNLTSLTGLDNIDAASITDLVIRNNPHLSTCEVMSVCDYLVTPNGDISLHDNAPSCNGIEEVIALCADGVPYVDRESGIIISPNPAQNKLVIINRNDETIVKANIYNQVGQKVISEENITGSINVSKLDRGVYIVEIILTESRIIDKLILE